MSTIVFQPLVSALTELLDDFAENHEVKVTDQNLSQPGTPTLGERLFIYHVYDYLSRWDLPLTKGFAHLLRQLTKGTHDRLTTFEVRGQGIHTMRLEPQGLSRFQKIAHQLMDLERYNSAIREAGGIQAEQQIVLNACPECGGITIGARLQPQLLCSAACRIAKKRHGYLADVNTRTNEGVRQAMSFVKWVTGCHATATFMTMLRYDESALTNQIGELYPNWHQEKDFESDKPYDALAEWTEIDVNHSKHNVGARFGTFDIKSRTEKEIDKSAKALADSKLLEATQELEELLQSSDPEVHHGRAANRLREVIAKIDPEHPLGYADVKIARAGSGVRKRRVTGTPFTKYGLSRKKGNETAGTRGKAPELRVTQEYGNPHKTLCWLQRLKGDQEEPWVITQPYAETEQSQGIEYFDVMSSEQPVEPGVQILEYKVRSNGAIIPSVADLYQLVKDAYKDTTGDWATAYLHWASRIDVTVIETQTDGSLKAIGPLVEDDVEDRDSRIAHHLNAVCNNFSLRVVAMLEAEKEAWPKIKAKLEAAEADLEAAEADLEETRRITEGMRTGEINPDTDPD